ncbi:MAG: HAD-IA family hydrolase [Nanoarchaeota archaeon]|nr:HAD-IA family hydrolase [Nanoarchaeota archaeon]
MIKAVLFDVGGVIIDSHALMHDVLKLFRPADEKKFWIDVNHRCIPLCKAEISLLEFWKDLARAYGKDIPEERLNALWVKDYTENIKVNEGIVEIIQKLHENYKLGIVSNSVKEQPLILEVLGLSRYFDAVLLSHELGIAKDTKKIFELATDKLCVASSECIFIDDIEIYLNMGRSAGMRGILFKDAEALKRDLRELGIKI